MKSVLHKVDSIEGDSPRLNSIIASQGLFRFSEKFFKDYPEAVSLIGKGTGTKIVSSVVEKLPDVFTDSPSRNSVRFLTSSRQKRYYKYILRDYLVENEYIDKFKLFIPEANNSGTFGEDLTQPTLGEPNDGSSDTFLNAGKFNQECESRNLASYMKSKFFRALLGINKVTQHCPPSVWMIIPLQDFTSNSDIDWTLSIKEIDQQLYKKYGLSEEEIDFIETHVKEMA